MPLRTWVKLRPPDMIYMPCLLLASQAAWAKVRDSCWIRAASLATPSPVDRADMLPPLLLLPLPLPLPPLLQLPLVLMLPLVVVVGAGCGQWRWVLDACTSPAVEQTWHRALDCGW